MFNSLFGGFVRRVSTSLSVAVLMATSGCVIAPMRVQFDPCVGQVAGSATLGGLAGGILGGRTGAIAGAVGAGLATAVQGCHQQAQQGQVVVVTQPPNINMAAQCHAAGLLVIRVGDGTYKCVIPIVLTPTVKPCTRTVQGWENDRYAGLSRGLRSASDKQVPC